MDGERTKTLAASEPGRSVAWRRTLRAGWISVALSAFFLFLSAVLAPDSAESGVLVWSFALMTARLFGIASFVIGGLAIYRHQWTEGIALLLLSVGLPLVSLLLHGTL